jgi:hypothetical protein
VIGNLSVRLTEIFPSEAKSVCFACVHFVNRVTSCKWNTLSPFSNALTWLWLMDQMPMLITHVCDCTVEGLQVELYIFWIAVTFDVGTKQVDSISNVFWILSVRISAGAPAILCDVFRSLPPPVQTNSRALPWSRLRPLPSISFPVRCSLSNHSTLCSMCCRRCR